MRARILASAALTPDFAYAVSEILEAVSNPHSALADRLRKKNGTMRRFLSVDLSTIMERSESQADLLKRHRVNAVGLGTKSFQNAARALHLKGEELGHLCCVTSTGFLLPGLATLIGEKIQLKPDCQLLDIVGMGCSAGATGLREASNWVLQNSEQYAAVICAEINSAILSLDDSRETMVINSLFGDGAGTLILKSAPEGQAEGWDVLAFESFVLFGKRDALRFEWNEEQGRYRLRLSREVPSVVSGSIGHPLERLLNRAGLRKSDIRFWLVHGGGPAMVTAIKNTLVLDNDQLRHTTAVLREFGNLSSASVVFSLCRLWREGSMVDGDHALIITMGPGISIELALLQWVSKRT